MRAFWRRAVGFIVGAALFVGSASAAARAQAPGCLRMHAGRTEVASDGAADYYANLLADCAIHSLVVSIKRGSASTARSVGDVPSGATRAIDLGTFPPHDAVLVTATYVDRRGVESLNAAPFGPTVDLHGAREAADVSVAAIGVIGTIVGVVVGDVLSSIREGRRRRLSHGRALATRYEEQYRAFLNAWGGVPSTASLKDALKTLRREAGVPRDLARLSEQTISQLEGPGSDVSKKHAARDLYDAFSDRLVSEEGLAAPRFFRRS